MKKLLRKIMAIFINGVEHLTGFIKGKECEGWMQGKKLWPPNEIKITYVQFLLESLPQGYTGYTNLEHIPACGAATSKAILIYRYVDDWGVQRTGTIEVAFKDGSISAESKYYTESGKTLIGTRHVDFEIDEVEFKDFEINVYQEANVITKTDRNEPSEPLKEDAWYYYTPIIKSFSYTGNGLLACGGNATPQFSISVTKIMSRYLKTEKTWKDMQSTAMEEIGVAPKQIDVQGGIEEWVDISAPVTTEYTDTASGEVTIKFDSSNLISAASLVSYDTGVISVNSMGTTPYPNGRTIGNAKIIVTVPRIRDGEQSRVEQITSLTQGANTLTEDWRVTPAFTSTEYEWEKPVFTSVTCALVGASGSPAKVIAKYSQTKYKYQYSISEQRNLYYVWTSGAEQNTGMSTGGEKTLKSKTAYSTVTSGGTLAYGGSALNNSGATIDSSGWVTGVSLYRTVTVERDIFSAWVIVTANGLTSEKSYVTVRQHYNHQYTENMSEGSAVTTIEYDYSDPSVTLKYHTGGGEESYKVTARGGSLRPKIKATQTSRRRTHTVGPTIWVKIYWDADPDGVETDKKTADYYSEWVDGQSYETTSLDDVIAWYGDNGINGASVSSSNGEVTVPSLGTTAFTEGNVLKVVATVRMNGKTSKGECYISQGSNTKTIKSTAYTGIKSAEFIDANGNKITAVLSYEAQTIFIRTQAIKTITYVWTSDAESTGTEYEYKRADSYTRSNTSLFEVMSSWNYGLNAAPVSISKNTDRENRRGGYIVATINGQTATTQSITQEVNTEPVTPTAETYLTPVAYQSSTTSGGQAVLVWDLKRTNKPLSATKTVNYSFTKGGPNITTTTVTGSVSVSTSVAEGDVVKSNIASGVLVTVTSYKET